MIIFLCIVVIYLFLAVRHYDKKQDRNIYIDTHKLHLDNDKKYENYLNWCEVNGEIPMNKKVFIKEIETKNKSIENLTK